MLLCTKSPSIPFTKFQIRWAEKIGEPDCHYLTRWVLTLFGYSVRLHHWTHSDDQRHLHDHPWWMLIFILKGSYIDVSPRGEELMKAGHIALRPAEHKHTVRVTSGCWSLLITGPKIRNWGFWIPGRDAVLRPLRYFSRYGHHQCEE